MPASGPVAITRAAAAKGDDRVQYPDERCTRACWARSTPPDVQLRGVRAGGALARSQRLPAGLATIDVHRRPSGRGGLWAAEGVAMTTQDEAPTADVTAVEASSIPGVDTVNRSSWNPSTGPIGASRTADHQYSFSGVGPYPGVTGILDVLHKQALIPWAKRTVAEYAVSEYINGNLGRMIGAKGIRRNRQAPCQPAGLPEEHGCLTGHCRPPPGRPAGTRQEAPGGLRDHRSRLCPMRRLQRPSWTITAPRTSSAARRWSSTSAKATAAPTTSCCGSTASCGCVTGNLVTGPISRDGAAAGGLRSCRVHHPAQ